jgi:hypothetical protein
MTRSLRTAPQVTGLERAAARLTLIAGGTFAALLLTLHAVEPEYDPTWRFVSE